MYFKISIWSGDEISKKSETQALSTEVERSKI